MGLWGKSEYDKQLEISSCQQAETDRQLEVAKTQQDEFERQRASNKAQLTPSLIVFAVGSQAHSKAVVQS